MSSATRALSYDHVGEFSDQELHVLVDVIVRQVDHVEANHLAGRAARPPTRPPRVAPLQVHQVCVGGGREGVWALPRTEVSSVATRFNNKIPVWSELVEIDFEWVQAAAPLVGVFVT